MNATVLQAKKPKKEPALKIIRDAFRSGEWKTAANIVTYVRFALIVPVVWILLAYPRGEMWLVAMSIFALAAISDQLDGMLARKYGSTDLGILIDPLADKLLILAAATSLSVGTLAAAAPIADCLSISSLIVLVREVRVAIIRRALMKDTELPMPPSRLGKASMWALSLAYFAAFVPRDHVVVIATQVILLTVAVVLSVASGIGYEQQHQQRRQLKRGSAL